MSLREALIPQVQQCVRVGLAVLLHVQKHACANFICVSSISWRPAVHVLGLLVPEPAGNTALQGLAECSHASNIALMADPSSYICHGQDPARLSVADDAASFVYGPVAVHVPDVRASQSALISQLREQAQGQQEELASPLSIQEAKAWLACSSRESAADMNDETLLHALKVR